MPTDPIDTWHQLLADRNVRLKEAHEMISKAVEQEPNNGAYLDSLGWVLFKQKKNEEAGDLRLLFTESPMQLQKWRVTDGAGQITEVTLTNIETGVKLDPRTFRFMPPKGYDADWKNR